MTDTASHIATVVIGRNEGARLVRALASIRGMSHRVVYVDSGSSDNSVQAARAIEAEVIELDLSLPFTAARARNAGLAAIRAAGTHADFIQFLDGDCELDPGWLSTALAFLETHPGVAVATGRLRELFPEASLWNRLCDQEWNTPVGQAKACGGIALMRHTALEQVDDFNDRLIAGEEPELCVRLRAKGWQIWRLDAEMAKHDAAMTHFSQWWKRARRGGYAAAEGMALHGRAPERHGVATVRRALVWSSGFPIVVFGLALAMGPWALLLLLAYPAQVIRLALRRGGNRTAWELALFLMLSKFAEAVGILEYWLRRLCRNPATIMEYK